MSTKQTLRYYASMLFPNTCTLYYYLQRINCLRGLSGNHAVIFDHNHTLLVY